MFLLYVPNANSFTHRSPVITGSYVDAHADMKKAHALYLENVKAGKRKPAKVLEIDMPKNSGGGLNSTKVTTVTKGSGGGGSNRNSEEDDDASIASLIRAVDSSADSAAEAFAAAVSAYGTARAAHTALVSLQALHDAPKP